MPNNPYLTITPVKKFDTATLDTHDSSPTHATLKIGEKVFQYTITMPYQAIASPIGTLPLIIAYLEKHVSKSYYHTSVNQDAAYRGTPYQLIFSSPDNRHQYEASIASSTEAIRTLLDDAIAHKGLFSCLARLFTKPKDRSYTDRIQTLVINANTDKYAGFTWRKITGYFSVIPEVEALPFKSIKPIHFPALTTLHLTIEKKSAPIIEGLADMLRRGCLRQLTALELHKYDEITEIKRHDEGWIGFIGHEEQKALIKLYQVLTKSQPLQQRLERLRALFWTREGTDAAIEAIKALRALKSLVIDVCAPRAELQGGLREWQVIVIRSLSDHGLIGYGGSVHSTYAQEVEAEVEESNNPDIGKRVIDLLDELHKTKRTLDALEILENDSVLYNGFDNHQMTGQQNYLTLCALIERGFLPRLNTIALSFSNTDLGTNNLISNKIFPDSAIDIADLLRAIGKKGLSIKEMILLQPEKQGYQLLFNAMAQGKFRPLEALRYRLPDQWQHLPNKKDITETDEDYKKRVEKALQTLLKAIQDKYLPNLKLCIIEDKAQADPNNEEGNPNPYAYSHYTEGWANKNARPKLKPTNIAHDPDVSKLISQIAQAVWQQNAVSAKHTVYANMDDNPLKKVSPKQSPLKKPLLQEEGMRL